MRIASFVRPSALVLITLLSSAACGTHRDLTHEREDEDAGPADEAGRGGRGGRGGSGGTAGGAAGSGPVTVRCGSAQCAAPVTLLSAFPTGLPAPVACCLDSGKSTCGTAAAPGAACEAVAVADTRCPGIDLGALGGAAQGGTMMLSGCCIDNACGQDGALFGRGCVENGEAKSMLSAIPFVGTLIAVPAARACDAPPDEPGDQDAGI